MSGKRDVGEAAVAPSGPGAPGSTDGAAPGDAAARLAEAKERIRGARFADAAAALEALLATPLQPQDELEARYMLAVALRYGADFERALETIDALLATTPDYGRAFQERGYTLKALGRPAEAAESFSRAVEANPALTASWQALAALHAAAGRDGEAAFARAQADALGALPAPLLHANDLLHEGKLLKAEQLCRKFLKDNKHHVEGMRLLAEIGVRLKIYDDAEFLLESAVELAPDHLSARVDYANLLNRKGKFARALAEAQRLLTAQPDNPAFQAVMAAALVGVGRIEEGIARYRQVLERTNAPAGVHLSIGHAYKTLGDFPRAIESYREAYRVKADYGDAFWSLANTKTYRFDDDEIARMTRFADAEDVALDDRIHLCFALGKAFEDRAEYARSFDFYQRGNTLRRQDLRYDPSRIEARISAQMDVCTRELFERRGHLGDDSPDPIFIVGLPRAGSTLLEQILASHSMVDGTMELPNILALAQRLGGRSSVRGSAYPAILWDLEDDYFRRFGRQYIEDTRVYRGTAPFFIDKMPNNFQHLGLIRLILPRAKIIDARREPMACCFSGFKQLFGEGQEFSYALEDIGAYYRHYVDLMAHWDRVLPGFVLRVNHEDVLDDLEGQVRRMLEFCGLPFEAQCLEFHRTERSIKTPSSEQVRQPLYRSGREQWRHYAAWLGPLEESLGALAESS